MQLSQLFADLFPRQVTVTHRERVYSALGALAAVLAVAVTSHYFLGAVHLPFLAASMGASTVLVLAVPHSAFSQPWPVTGGHLVSALVGITCAKLIPDIYLASSLAVALAVVSMFYLRCLHPPGGGTALLAVIGGPTVQALGYQFALTPVLLNALLLLTAALLVNRLIPGRHYPIRLSMPTAEEARGPEEGALGKLSFNQDDLIAALREIGEVIDVTGEDLTRIYSLATLHSHRRRLGEVRCGDIMTHPVVAVTPGTTVEDTWSLIRQHNIRGMPVVDENRRVVGVVAMADFLKLANWQMCTLPQQLMRLLRGRSVPTVDEIMTSPVITVAADAHILDLFRIFAEKRINHLPVVDGENQLVGIATRIDLLSALVGDVVETA